MQEKHRLEEELLFIKNIHKLTQAYEEISVVKMQSIRGMVFHTRSFLNGLSEVFYEVKTSYRNQLIQLMKQKKKKNSTILSTLQKNGKTVLVLLSTNKRLYGTVPSRVFELFLTEAKKTEADLVIIGKYGKGVFDTSGFSRASTYFELPEDTISFEHLKPLIAHIIKYEHVTIFYGKFANIISQVPTASPISGEQPLEKDNKNIVAMKFLFEPSLEKITNFFETQIFTALCKQTVLESQLAYYASRIRAMEESFEKINLKMSLISNQNKRLKNSLMNKKQLEALSGISLWS